ncbi:MAG TPA: methylthioribulose 1-phosphate dehydratase [Nitrospiria bacterium]
MGKKLTAQSLKSLLCELLRLFYVKDWVSGTGGGVCAKPSAREVFIAPTGVHKERVRPADFFTVNPSNGKTIKTPRDKSLRLSECSSIFCEIIRTRDAGSVMHSHGLPAVLAGDLARGGDRIIIDELEMLKGIRGLGNLDKHSVPVISNTPFEPELVGLIQAVFRKPDFDKSFCILVRNHGAYIWGKDIWEAKRHAEVYHFLFEGVVARSRIR